MPEYGKEDSLAPLKTFAIAGGIALAGGGMRAIRLGEFGPNIMPARWKDAVNRTVNSYYAIADRGLQNTVQSLVDGQGKAVLERDSFLYNGGIFHDASEALKIAQGMPAIRQRLGSALAERYKSTGRTGEVTIGRILDSLQSRPAGQPNALYKSSLGVNFESGQIDALRKLTTGKNPLLSRNLTVSEDLFLSPSTGKILEDFNSNTIDSMIHGFKIPFVGNPFDFLTKIKQPLVARATSTNVNRLIGQETEGAIINGELFTAAGGNTPLKKIRAMREGSSEERAFFMSDAEARAPRPTSELFSEGFYDAPTLDKFASSLVENPFVEKLFGKKVSWINKTKGGAEYAPILGEIEERLVNSKNPIIQAFGLDKFGKRFARTSDTFLDVAKEFVEKTGKTSLYRATEDAPLKPNKWDIFENLMGGMASGKRGHVSLTEEEAKSFFDPQKNVVDMDSLRKARFKRTAVKNDVHGRLEPSLEQRSRNKEAGRDPNETVRAHYTFAEDNLKTSTRITGSQLINTTTDLLESMTGLGIKPGGAVATTAAMVMGSTALYIAYEGFHFFDYMLESVFGLGIEKTALYGYSAARAAQQSAMLPLEAALAPLESIAPGISDSPLGHGLRGFAGLYLGNKFGSKIGHGKLAGVTAALAFGLPTIHKSASDVWDEHVGNKEVAIRRSRFWFMGPDDWRGSDIIGYRKSLIASRLDDSQYDMYGGKGNYFLHGSILSSPLRMAGGLANNLPGMESITAGSALDPYYLERRNYYDNPYPVTGDMFADVPIIGPVLGQTVGQIFKPQRLMHTEELSAYYSGENRATPLQRVAMQLGEEVILPAERMARPKNLGDAFGESIDNMMDIFGMRGFLIATGKEFLTGNKSFAGNPKTLRDAGELDSLKSTLYDAQLGGMFGQSEIIRRFVTNNNSLDQYNPIEGEYSKKYNLYGLDRQQSSFVELAGIFPGSGMTTDPLITWDTALGKDTFRIPYVSTKLYGNRNPLEEYQHKISVGTTFYDWSDPVDTIIKPFLRESRQGDPFITPFLNAIAISTFARGPRSEGLMQGASAAFGISNIFFGEEDPRERDRRALEQFGDTVQYQKIQNLKELALRKGDEDALSKLSSMEKKTMTGLDYSLQGDAFAKNAYRVLPRADRRYLVDFANAPENQRQNILETVPEYMKDMLNHMWGERNQSTGQSIRMAMQRHSIAMKRYNDIASKDWEGWSNSNTTGNIKLSSVMNSAGSLHDYGYWGSDERDFMATISYDSTSYDYAPSAGEDGDEAVALSGQFGSYAEVQTTMASMDANSLQGDIMVDRSSQIRKIQHRREGRF